MPEENNKQEEEKSEQTQTTDYRDDSGGALAEIRETNQEILKLTKKINNFVFWQKIFGVIKILIIIIPLILAWRLVDSLMSDPSALLNNPWFSTYMNGLIETVGKNIDPSALDPSNIPAEYQHLLNK